MAGGGGIGATAAELAQIDVDLKRTLPAHGQLFSSPESPYRQALLELLTAYRRHNPDLGYKQGCGATGTAHSRHLQLNTGRLCITCRCIGWVAG